MVITSDIGSDQSGDILLLEGGDHFVPLDLIHVTVQEQHIELLQLKVVREFFCVQLRQVKGTLRNPIV